MMPSIQIEQVSEGDSSFGRVHVSVTLVTLSLNPLMDHDNQCAMPINTIEQTTVPALCPVDIKFSFNSSTNLRLLDTYGYASKIAKIFDLKTFWPLIQL